jgi:adenylylsulfate kinase-like enzyme
VAKRQGLEHVTDGADHPDPSHCSQPWQRDSMSDNTGHVIMLNGPVGVGKTTVACELIKLLPAPMSYIEGDRFWPPITKPVAQDRRENFHLLMRIMTAASRPLARSGYSVLPDFSIPPYFLEIEQKILKEIPIDYVMLLPRMEVCAVRAAARGDGAIADYTPYRSFYDVFCDADIRGVLPDDDADAQTQATRVLKGLEAGAFRVS